MLNLQFEGKEIRVVEGADPQWVARDVAEVLGIAQSTLSERLKTMPDEWKGIGLIDTPGGKQEMATVREPGLYELIFRSDKEVARRFQRFVFEVVLPEIRRTGSYQGKPLEGEATAEKALSPVSEGDELVRLDPYAIHMDWRTATRGHFLGCNREGERADLILESLLEMVPKDLKPLVICLRMQIETIRYHAQRGIADMQTQEALKSLQK